MNWISVNDALPDIGREVLVQIAHSNTTICKRRRFVYVAQRTEAQEYCNNQRKYEWTSAGPVSFHGQDVTHWCKIVDANGILLM